MRKQQPAHDELLEQADCDRIPLHRARPFEVRYSEAHARNGNFDLLLDWNLQPIIVARRVGPDLGGRAVLDVTDINAGQVNAVDPHIELLGRPMRKVEPELLTAKECAGFVGIPTVKDALLL